MAKALLKHGEFELHKMEEKHVIPFCNNLSPQNIREFQVLYEEDPLSSLYDVLNDDLAHVVTVEGRPVAALGVYEGVVWVMFSRDVKKYWRSFVRMSPKILRFYHQFYEQLDAIVWDENTFIHNWLVHLGFEPQFIEEDNRGMRTVHFVRCNYWYDDIDSGPSRPVMH